MKKFVSTARSRFNVCKAMKRKNRRQMWNAIDENCSSLNSYKLYNMYFSVHCNVFEDPMHLNVLNRICYPLDLNRS